MPFRRHTVLIALAAVAALAGCTATPASHGDTSPSKTTAKSQTLTIYTDQHAELIKNFTQEYTAKTGVKFRIQQDANAGQVEAEGKASPADIFLSEDPAPVAELGKKGLLVTLPKTTFEKVRPNLSSGKDLWVAYAARTRVLYYNPKLISEAQLPKHLVDITDARYKGKFAWAPSGAFVATVQYLLDTIGTAKTTAFLKTVKANGVNEQSNGNIRDTVEAGKHAIGLSNHYYWWIKAAEVGGPSHMASKIYHFPEADSGNLILSSGAAILKTSKNKDAAEKFIAWLVDANGGQKLLEGADVNENAAQYPVATGTKSGVVGSLDAIKSPPYDMDIYADEAQAQNLLQSLGMS